VYGKVNASDGASILEKAQIAGAGEAVE
jgi:hypothetical protein